MSPQQKNDPPPDWPNLIINANQWRAFERAGFDMRQFAPTEYLPEPTGGGGLIARARPGKFTRPPERVKHRKMFTRKSCADCSRCLCCDCDRCG